MKNIALKNQKTDLRLSAKRSIAKIIADKPRFYQRQNDLIKRIEFSDEFKNAKKILTYFPLEDEFDLSSIIISNPNKIWALPRPIGKNRMISFQVYELFNLQTLKNGLKVPVATNPVLRPEEFDLVLIPGLMFDKQGYRLGRGGGYYDFLLTRLRANCKTIGIAFEELYVEELNIQEEHDMRIKKIFTA